MSSGRGDPLSLLGKATQNKGHFSYENDYYINIITVQEWQWAEPGGSFHASRVIDVLATCADDTTLRVGEAQSGDWLGRCQQSLAAAVVLANLVAPSTSCVGVSGDVVLVRPGRRSVGGKHLPAAERPFRHTGSAAVTGNRARFPPLLSRPRRRARACNTPQEALFKSERCL